MACSARYNGYVRSLIIFRFETIPDLFQIARKPEILVRDAAQARLDPSILEPTSAYQKKRRKKRSAEPSKVIDGEKPPSYSKVRAKNGSAVLVTTGDRAK